MHSHERTLLANLGFNDPDKKDPRHDLACQYLASEDVAERILALLPDVDPRRIRDYADQFAEAERQFVRSRTEVHLTKGAGQYQTTIGFIDVAMVARVSGAVGFKCYGMGSLRRDTEPAKADLQVTVEVKIKRIPIGDILRQIGLYKTYLGGGWFVLATEFDLTSAEVEMLQKAGVTHIRLGRAFDDYCEEQRETPRIADSPEF